MGTPTIIDLPKIFILPYMKINFPKFHAAN